MRIKVVLAAALAVVLALPTAVATASGPSRTVITFDPTAGEFPEGVVFDRAGNLYVSLVPANQIRKITPDGSQSVFADFGPAGAGPAGLTLTPAGAMYAADPANDMQTNETDPARRGVYRVGRDGTPVRVPGTEAMIFPNDLRSDESGTVYVTDSIGGSVWRVPPRGPAQLWAHDPLLTGTGALGLGFPMGANGIAVVGDAVIVANSDRGMLVRIPIRRDGSAGTPTVMAQSPLLVAADGLTLDAHGAIYVVSGQNRLLRLDPDGTITTLATAADGLNQPSTAAFGTGRSDHRTLYIANFSLYTQAPTPGVITVKTSVPGRPRP